MPRKPKAPSVDCFVSIKKCNETVSVLKQYLKAQEKAKDVGEDGKPAKKSLLDGDDHENETVMLQVDFKKIPNNQTTYVNRFGPLPNPWLLNNDTADICLFVRDPDPKNAHTDRELDLQNTRDHYINILRQDGVDFDEDFMTNRLTIMPMRELLTEYKTNEAKARLANAFELFLADKTLVNNKFKELHRFLGTRFWIRTKKAPVPIDLKKRGKELGEDIRNQLAKTEMYVSGRGSTEIVKIGLIGQDNISLGKNLFFVLAELKSLFGSNISILRLKTKKSMAIPFYCDLASANLLDPDDLAPKTTALSESHPDLEDDFPLFNKLKVSVSAIGEVKFSKKAEIGEEDNDNDAEVDALEQEWILKTNRTRKRQAMRMSQVSAAKRLRNRQQNRPLLTAVSNEDDD